MRIEATVSATKARHAHRTLNVILGVVAGVLMCINTWHRGSKAIVLNEKEGESKEVLPPFSHALRKPEDESSYSVALVANDSCGVPISSSCTLRDIRCFTPGEPGTPHPNSGPQFQELFVIGESWKRRQWHATLQPIQRSPQLVNWRNWCREATSDSSTASIRLDSKMRVRMPGARIVHFGARAPYEMMMVIPPSDIDDHSCFGAIFVGVNAGEASNVILQDEQDDFIRRFVLNDLGFGPHDFRIRVVGSSISSELLSFCVTTSPSMSWYMMPFSVNSAEAHHLEAEHVYEGFRAFDQLSLETLSMVRRPVLSVVENKGSKGDIVGAQHHDPRLNLFHFHHPEFGRAIRKSKFRASKNYIWDQFTFRSNESVQCSLTVKTSAATRSIPSSISHNRPFSLDMWSQVIRVSPMKSIGRWQRSHINTSFPQHLSIEALKTLEYHHVHFERHDPQAVYRYHLFSDVSQVPLLGFSPCSFHAQLSSSIHNRRGSPHRINFWGDSHIRVTFTHFRNFLAAGLSGCPLEDHKVKSMSGKTCDFGESFELNYRNDVLLDRFTGSDDTVHELASAGGNLVLGMGSWALGGKGSDPSALANSPQDFGRWKLSKYKRFMERVASKIVQVLLESDKGAATVSTVTWLTIPAYPLNTRRFSKLKGEHRANPRIQAFNALAKHVLVNSIPVALHSRVSIVDVFDITYPLMHLSLDHNHFTTYPQDAVLHCLLNAVVPAR